MSSEMSVARVLAKLEARAAVHREQQVFHAQKETHRMRREKRIHLVRVGVPHYEALYGQGARPVE